MRNEKRGSKSFVLKNGKKIYKILILLFARSLAACSVFNFRYEVIAQEAIVFGSISHESSVEGRRVLSVTAGGGQARR
jgi:hypothetical protein